MQCASSNRIRGLVALLVVAGLAHSSFVLAQIYKCTDAGGRTAYLDKPCAPAPGAAGSTATGKAGVKQEVVRPPPPAVANVTADATSAMCAKHESSKPTDAMIQSLPERQRETVIGALRGVITGMARGPGAQENIKRLSLHIDATRNAIICVPQQRAQAPGASPVTTYTALRIEPNGRMETRQPGAPPLVYNDANEPLTVASRCSSLVLSCVQSNQGRSIDECFEKAPVCPGGRLDPALSCCPQACRGAYSRERSRGTEDIEAMAKVLFGDYAGAVSCVPGMPKKESSGSTR